MKRLARTLAALGLAVPFACAAHAFAVAEAEPEGETADPNPPGLLDMHYDFYVGGLPIAEIDLSGTISPEGYTASTSVVTRGILELLVAGRVTAQATGYRRPYGHLAPDAYATDYSTRSETRSVQISYDGASPEAVAIEPPEDAESFAADAADAEGALDPVTAAVMLMMPGERDLLCNRTIPVFDGKRRYDIVLLPISRRPAGDEPPALEWAAPTVRCFGIYERIAGFEEELQTEQRYYPFDVWFEAEAVSGAGGEALYRAVRIAGNTSLGFAIGNLRGSDG